MCIRMNIKRFYAPTSREALAKARMAFGAGTLILSNRSTPDGVEVMATAEDTLEHSKAAASSTPPSAAAAAVAHCILAAATAGAHIYIYSRGGGGRSHGGRNKGTCIPRGRVQVEKDQPSCGNVDR